MNLKPRGYSHTFPDDVDVLLVGPTGANALMMSDVGGGDDVSRKNLVLDDQATDFLADRTQISTGTFKPTQGIINDGGNPVRLTFLRPAPTRPPQGLTARLCQCLTPPAATAPGSFMS